MLVVAGTIRNEIDSKGYCVIDVASYEEFRESVDELGETITVTEIRVDDARRAMLSSCLPMPFHTDHPSARYIAWYCAQPADEGGDSLLVDVRTVISTLNSADAHELRKLEVKVPPLTRTEAFESRAILTNGNVYYAEWLLQKPCQSDAARALDRFKSALRACEPIRIHLSRNQALFIDNHRMLHGRNGFTDTTKPRRLVRHWIQDVGCEAAQGIGARP